MKKVVLLSKDYEGIKTIENILEKKYELHKIETFEEVKAFVNDNKADITGIIIHKPSVWDGIDDFISWIKDSNTFLFAVPIFVIPGLDTIEEDEKFLGGPVIDILDPSERENIIYNRVGNVSQSVNSLSFNEFADMLRVLPSLVYLKDDEGRYVFSTQYWHHLDHYDDPDWTIAGKTDLEIRKDTENAKKAMESDKRIISSGVGTSYIIEENEDDQQEFLQLIKEPLKDENGRVKGIIALINDVTEEELLRRKLEKISFTDELTGVNNRTFYENYVKNVSPDKFPISIISADCDNLKNINDKYGHMVGDEYIRMSVTMMKTILPESAVICRMGGDEFVVFLEKTDTDTARRFVNVLNEMEDIFKIVDQKLSVSFGFSTMESYDSDTYLEEYIAKSDADMYKSKKRKKIRRS